MAEYTEINNSALEDESDAQILWEDVCDLLEDEGLSSPTLAMFRNCKGLEIIEKEPASELVIGIGSGFIQRNIQNNLKLINTALERAAFQPMVLTSRLIKRHEVVQQNQTTISPEDLNLLNQSSEETSANEVSSFTYLQPKKGRPYNPLVEEISEADVNLTFDTFVEGEENQLALQASKAVANGSHAYNPLFIYGNSGIGKTHLLKAIQNYLYKNEPNRVCVYRQARDFVRDYTNAMQDPNKDVKDALEQNYRNIDVLIIDDIQGFKGAAKTVNFFFDTFNYLISNNKQIVLAADETPLELGFEERVTSRIGMGVPIPIQAPNYELKLALIQSFYKRMKEDALKDGTKGFSGTIKDEELEYMAKKAGTNIRTIKSFCQACILSATRKQDAGEVFTQEDINKAVISYWGLSQRNFTISQVQKFVEQRYGISHSDLVSNKRTKNLMEPRHVGVWLAREFTDLTLQQIGEKFGGRTHATVKHSIWWVENCQKKDKVFYDRTLKMKEDIQATAE